MKCPKCGHEIPSGLLLCEKCGAEINIVPEFDIEIENSINETLSSIVAEIAPKEVKKARETKKSQEIEKPRKDEKNNLEEDFFVDHFAQLKKHLGNGGIAILILIFVVIISAVILISLSVYRNYSVDYQLRKVKEYVSEENYPEADNYLNKALELSGDDIEAIFRIVDCYRDMGENERAKGLIKDIILKQDNDYSEKIKLYDKLFEILAEESDFDSINRILIEGSDVEIQTHYNEYMAYKPTFKTPTGSYQTEIDVEVETNTEGTVRYTLNGNDPDAQTGQIYEGPIHIGPGESLVKAVFVNSFGAVSEMAEAFYLVDSSIPDAPIVSPESGTFDASIMVTVDLESLPEGTAVYYTDDGSDPNTEISPIYEKPIVLTQGHFNFSFILVSPEGVLSPVTRRSYSVELKSNVSVEMAKTSVMSALLEQNLIIDTNGTAPGNIGKYSYEYDSIIEISGFGYYHRLDEFFEDNTGEKKRTGLLYAVSLDTGVPYRLLVNPDNTWGLIPLKQ